MLLLGTAVEAGRIEAALGLVLVPLLLELAGRRVPRGEGGATRSRELLGETGPVAFVVDGGRRPVLEVVFLGVLVDVGTLDI